MNKTVADILRSYSDKFQGKTFFFAPGIPPKKLKNAINAYAAELSEEEVLLLEDSSLFGSAKDGFLLNSETLFVHPIMQKPWKIALRDIKSLFIEEDQDPANNSVYLRVNDPQGNGLTALIGHEAQLFAGMLKEIKGALVSDGTAQGEGELVVNLIARIPRLTFVRMVPLEGGKPRRYLFTNLHLKGKEYGKVVNEKAGLFSHPSIFLEMKDNKVFARTESKDVLVNGAALVGKCELTDRDRISLGKDKDLVVYEYQADPKAAKQSRQAEEKVRGITRLTGGKVPERIVTGKFAVDPKGLKLVDGSGGKHLAWKEVDEVTFAADYDSLYKLTNNPGNAAGQGMVIGSQQAAAFLESQRSSDFKAVFPAPEYKVEFLSKGAVVAKLEGVNQHDCAMLDDGIEFYAPMDLVKFK
jgi:hypothetical protein